MVGGDEEAYARVEPVLARARTPPASATTVRACAQARDQHQPGGADAGLLRGPAARRTRRHRSSPRREVMTGSAIGSPMLEARAPLVLDLPDDAWFDVGLMPRTSVSRWRRRASATCRFPPPASPTMCCTSGRLGYERRDIAAIFRCSDGSGAPARDPDPPERLVKCFWVLGQRLDFLATGETTGSTTPCSTSSSPRARPARSPIDAGTRRVLLRAGGGIEVPFEGAWRALGPGSFCTCPRHPPRLREPDHRRGPDGPGCVRSGSELLCPDLVHRARLEDVQPLPVEEAEIERLTATASEYGIEPYVAGRRCRDRGGDPRPAARQGCRS